MTRRDNHFDSPTTQSERGPQAKHLSPDGEEILKDRTEDHDEELTLGDPAAGGENGDLCLARPTITAGDPSGYLTERSNSRFLIEILPRMKILPARIQNGL